MVELGHVALRVRVMERSIDFYKQAVVLKLVGRIGGTRAAVLTGGRQHHELLLVAAPTMDAGASPRKPIALTSGAYARRSCYRSATYRGLPAFVFTLHGRQRV